MSVLSFGSWVSFGAQLDTDAALDCLDVAYQGGMNFFDNAEAYAGGESERIMGEAIAQLDWPRHSYVISTKLFWGIHGGVNMSNTLNRKYLLQAIEGSLERLDLEFVDLLVLPPRRPEHADRRDRVGDVRHRGERAGARTGARRSGRPTRSAPRGRSPIVTTCTSRWWSSPSTTCCSRRRVEREYARLYEDIGLGLTTGARSRPGLLTGKYLDGVPEGQPRDAAGLRVAARDAHRPGVERRRSASCSRSPASSTARSPSSRSAWCAKNPHVSSVITGASRPEQVTDNLGALDVLPRLDDEVMKRIKDAVR